MSNCIVAAQVFILNGTFTGTIRFEQGLNIISGENGTLKTKLLQAIKSAQVIDAAFPSTTRLSATYVVRKDPSAFLRIVAISPKRNSERRTYDDVIAWMRQQSRDIDTIINERGGTGINESTFDNYPSPADTFYALFEKRRSDGSNAKDRMEEVTSEFTAVVQSVFPSYKWSSQWEDRLGTSRVRLLKRGKEEVPIEALSAGEQEVLSLILFLFISKDAFDVYLIDEPEVHLNWHLEENLFTFLSDFCAEYGKQIIVATHSRAIFKPDFLERTQFLSWDDTGNIAVGKELTDDQRRRLAGEAINIVKLGDFKGPTFFVENDAHSLIIDAPAKTVGVSVSTVKCSSSSNVRSFYRLSKNESEFENALFITDGDNEGNPYPMERQFLHLDKYYIENYLLDFDLAAQITGKTKEDIATIVFAEITRNRDKILAKNKFLDFLFDRLKVEDITPSLMDKLDASMFFKSHHSKLGLTFKRYLELYTAAADREGMVYPVVKATFGQN